MSAIFLSASVPIPGRGEYYKTAEPFLIQAAVRELVTLALGRRLIVWGGHPAITPMVWAVCEDLGVDFSAAVTLYQSRFFAEMFPEEVQRFANVQYIDAVDGDREASLLRMRRAMLSRTDLAAAVYIGGMDGVLHEHSLFAEFHPNSTVVTVPSAGGAALELAGRLGQLTSESGRDIDFARLFHQRLEIGLDEPRTARL